MKDFYVVLPSNACPDIHPENSSNKYIVSWEEPIKFDEPEKWRVALTESNFSHIVSSVNSNFGIEYGHVVTKQYYADVSLVIQKNGKMSIQMPDNFPPPVVMPTFDEWQAPEVYNINMKTKGDQIRVGMKTTTNFSLTFASSEDAMKVGFESIIVTASPIDSTYTHVILAPNNVPKEDDTVWPITIRHVIIEYTSRPFVKHERIYLTKNQKYWEQAEIKDMVQVLYSELNKVFYQLEYSDAKRRMRFVCHSPIKSITFLGGLNIVMGFKHKHWDFNTSSQWVNAEYEPYVRHGINNLYIYASICQPIRVGGVCVPLLKSVWIDVNKREYKVGEVRNLVVKNPMYLPVSASSINDIEINIRSDSGRLVPFIDGSTTSLTLHFKKYDNQ